MIVGADLVDGERLGPALEALLADLTAAYVHIHYAKPGCYAASGGPGLSELTPLRPEVPASARREALAQAGGDDQAFQLRQRLLPQHRENLRVPADQPA